MLFRHDIHGWHYSDDSEEMKKAGWKESSDAEFKAFVAAKNKKSRKLNALVVSNEYGPNNYRGRAP